MTNNLARELRRASEDERGGMIFSGLMSFIGLAILTVFTINIASEAIERERMQHAADAAAYATAVCMARGMNATASITHQMGEQASFAIIAEAFTGPEPTYSPCAEEKNMNDFLKELKSESYLRGDDEKDKVKERVKEFCDEEGAVGGGACYDARMNLKYLETKALTFQAMCWYLNKAAEILGKSEAQHAITVAKYVDQMESIVSETSQYEIGETIKEMQETISGLTTKAQEAEQELSENLEKASDAINLCQDKLGEIFTNGASKLNDAAEKIDGLKMTALNPDKQKELDEILAEYHYSEITDVADSFRNSAAQMESSANSVSSDVSVDPSFDNPGEQSRIRSGGNSGKTSWNDAQREWSEAKRTWNEALHPTWNQWIQEHPDDDDNWVQYQRGLIARIRPYVGAEKARSIEATLNSVESDMAEVRVLFDGTYFEFGKGDQKVYGGEYGVDKLVGTLTDTMGQAKDLLNNVQKGLDNAGAMAANVSALSGLAGGLTRVDLAIEYAELRRLEKILSSDGPLGAKSVKDRTRDKVEDVAKSYPTVVGADSSNVDSRAICRQINATLDELKNEYEFDEVAVAPLDGLTPDFIDNEGGVTPTLPVLVEEPPMKEEPSQDYLDDSANEKWKNKGSESRYKKELPTIPWNGNDKDRAVELIHTAAEVALLADFAITTAQAIVYACSYPHFAKMAKGVLALGFLVKMMFLYSEFKFGAGSYMGEDAWRPTEYGHRNNPSFWSYPRKVFEYKDAQTLQWTRATYPIVDALNSHLRAHYKFSMPNSNLATYLQAWSYRYALSEPYFLSGLERPYSDNDDSGANRKRDPCRLYVIAGSDSQNKGNDALWTDDQYRGRVVDEMFSVCAVVQKKRGIIGGSSIFQRLGASQGTTAVAQAYFYPANGRNEKEDGTLNETDSKNHRKQPPTAWDTLAWKNADPGKPFVCNAKDWESQPASRSSKKSWQEIIQTGQLISAPSEVQTEFTWRACLAPVTKSRMEKLAKSPKATPTMRLAAKNAAANIDVVAH